jgi:cellulose synthase/poly-beta-1,6-N-acetylglucosamine synthase-like glycosyltransferase
MSRLTAVIHTHNDALRLGRCLETLYPCDEIVIVDHGSVDRTMYVALEYGASIIADKSSEDWQHSLQRKGMEWLLCLNPRESLTENLAASLFEWKSGAATKDHAFSVLLKEETTDGWIEHPTAQTRMVPDSWQRWDGHLPAHEPASYPLEGALLRFALP